MLDIKFQLIRLNAKSEVITLYALAEKRNTQDWFQLSDLQEITGLSRSSVWKGCEKLQEIGIAKKAIKAGTEKKTNPTALYRLPEDISDEDISEIIQYVQQKGFINSLKDGEDLSNSVLNMQEEIFDSTIPESFDSKVSTSLTSYKVDEQSDLLNSDGLILKETPEENSKVENSLKMEETTLTLDEVWDFVEEMAAMFTQKIAEQDSRIQELEEKLSLTSTKASQSPEERLNQIRSQLNFKNGKVK